MKDKCHKPCFRLLTQDQHAKVAAQHNIVVAQPTKRFQFSRFPKWNLIKRNPFWVEKLNVLSHHESLCWRILRLRDVEEMRNDLHIGEFHETQRKNDALGEMGKHSKWKCHSNFGFPSVLPKIFDIRLQGCYWAAAFHQLQPYTNTHTHLNGEYAEHHLNEHIIWWKNQKINIMNIQWVFTVSSTKKKNDVALHRSWRLSGGEYSYVAY